MQGIVMHEIKNRCLPRQDMIQMMQRVTDLFSQRVVVVSLHRSLLGVLAKSFDGLSATAPCIALPPPSLGSHIPIFISIYASDHVDFKAVRPKLVEGH